MATWDDVRRIAFALPEVAEEAGAHPSWRVRRKLVAWDRPLRKADLAHLGERAPSGPIVGVRTADAGVAEALVASEAPVVFTTPHFDGYPSVLVDLDRASVELLEELVEEAWLAQAPKRLAAAYLAERTDSS